MKIILLSTRRGLRPDFVNELLAKLGPGDSDEVCMVTWHPTRPLPVNRHLVLGPHLRVSGALATVQRVQRRPELIAADADPVPVATTVEAATLVEAAIPSNAAVPVPSAANATAQLPVLHPRRMRKAVAWRVRRLKKAARTQTAGRLTGVRTHPQFRKVRNRLSPSVSLGFAAGCLRAIKVHDMARDADLVVALDAASQRGAWTLAQRVPGPDVVIGIPAAKRLLEQRKVLADIPSPGSNKSNNPG